MKILEMQATGWLEVVFEFLTEETGASAIEYALLAALLGSAIIGAQTAMGQSVVNMYQGAVGTITTAMGS